VVGNWSINPIVSWHGGFPLDLRGNDNSGTGDIFSPRPNCNGSVAYPKTVVGGIGLQWFDPTAFSEPTSGFGNCPSQGPVIGPGYFDADLSLQKNFPVSESMKFQFRVDFLNAFNHPNFNAPGTSCGSVTGSAVCGVANFGPTDPNTMGTTNTTQDSRQLQFALKFYF